MPIKRIVFIILFIVLSDASLYAQSVTINPADATASVKVSSNSQGLLVQRMTATQRATIPTPVAGLLVYQTDSPEGFYYYNSLSTWVLLGLSNSALNTLSKTTIEPAANNCKAYTKVDFGLDANANGVLDAGEINAALTKYICGN